MAVVMRHLACVTRPLLSENLGVISFGDCKSILNSIIALTLCAQRYIHLKTVIPARTAGNQLLRRQ